MSQKIHLSPLEAALAARVGIARRMTSMIEKRKDRAGRRNDWTADVEGCAAEMAFAKWLGVYWLPTNKTFSMPDVGEVEVKLSREIPELAVPVNCEMSRAYLLVMGAIPEFEIVGWVRGSEALAFEPTTKKYYPARWIPREKLRPAKKAELREVVR